MYTVFRNGCHIPSYHESSVIIAESMLEIERFAQNEGKI
ncbi:hypothetical protein HNQ47_000571 [Catenisphaera adipataccumulans]|uniref:Uncharacterized protein n=1 Tax=Catenisphaera adipataccumulans TaxID=700500 RepID=A0A7W8CYD8_9FIRM|nr:hypothetical protein [Catenisphaera adipataccumulans]